MKASDRRSGFWTAAVILLIVNTLAIAGVIVFLVIGGNSKAAGENAILEYESSENGKYVLYIGLNDKETYSQIISTEEAKNTVNNIVLKYVGGYTVYEAKGGWTDETGTLTEENTLVYHLSGVSERDVISIMDEVLVVLNQNSILVERHDLSYIYYDGK